MKRTPPRNPKVAGPISRPMSDAERTARRPCAARNAVGETVRPMPAASSLMPTDSTVLRGLSLSATRASQSRVGRITRSRNCTRSPGVPVSLQPAVLGSTAQRDLTLAVRIRHRFADEVGGGGEDEDGKCKQHGFSP